MRARRVLAVMATLGLTLAACGEDGPGAADVAAEGGGEEVAAADVSLAETELGEVLVDGDGMTLYLFTRDEDGQSVCEDACAEAWPPLLSDAPTAGDGVDASLLGTTTRPDGATQVTYNGWPLYTWAADQQPGDVTGQGVEDVWFVLGADGEAIGADAAASAGDDSAGDDQADDTDQADDEDEDASTGYSY